MKRFRHDLRAVKVVWKREMIRFRRDRTRAIVSLIQPVLYLFVLGTGLSSLSGLTASDSIDFKTFMFPGVISMTVMFLAMFSAASIVWDREFGFLREMMVAPISRWAIVLGKCLGGATVSIGPGLVLLALSGFVGVPYSPLLMATLVGELFILAFTITAFGIMAAAKIKTFQSFMALTQMVIMPMFFLSGALYPLTELPPWLHVLTRLDPLTYIVDPMRQAVFSHVNVTPAIERQFNPGITLWGYNLPVLLELTIVGAMGLMMLTIAIVEFKKAE